LDHVLIELKPVGHGDQVGELQAEFVLGRGHLVVVLFRLEAEFAHDREHFAPQVLRRVHRIDGEVAALGSRAMAHIAFGVFAAGIHRQLDRVERIAGVVRRGGPAHVVEHEELGLGPEEHLVAHARRLHIGQRLLGDGARIAVVGLHRVRVQHVAEQEQGGLLVEGIDVGGREVRLQQHVGLVDGLPSGDGGAVEHGAFGQEVIVDQRQIEGDVLHLAAHVGEANVDVFDVLFLDFLIDVRRLHRRPLVRPMGGKSDPTRGPTRALR
jgi:hypothetical protein